MVLDKYVHQVLLSILISDVGGRIEEQVSWYLHNNHVFVAWQEPSNIA